MPNGDAAAAAGMDVVPSTADVRLGYDEVNKSRDYIAEHETTGTHPASAIASGVLAAARIPSLDASKITTGTMSAARVAAGYPATAVASSGLGFPTNVDAALALLSAEIDAIPTPTDTQVADTVSSAAYSRTVSGGGFFQMWMDNGLRIGRNVSSIRYKEHVEPTQLDPAQVLALQPVTYHRIGSPDGVYEYGLIAEDVQEHVPHVVVWDGDQVEGVRYDLLSVALLDVVKAQQRTLDELAQRVADMERTVNR